MLVCKCKHIIIALVSPTKNVNQSGCLPVSRVGLEELCCTQVARNTTQLLKRNGLNMYLLTWKDIYNILRGKKQFHNTIPLFK